MCPTRNLLEITVSERSFCIIFVMKLHAVVMPLQ